MHPAANHLIQLQELSLIRDERKVTAGGKQLEQLNESIEEMTDELPNDVRTMFIKLFKKDHTVIVPTSDGNCAGCGLKLPISLVQVVRVAKELHHCPSCTRFLYFQEESPRRTTKGHTRSEPRKVGIARFSAESLMIPRLAATDRDGVISELAHQMAQEGFVEHEDRLVREALRREAIIGTAIENGLAFPHVRGVEGGGLTMAFGVSAKGIKFGGSGKTLTRLIFFMVIPTAASAFYLKLLAGLTQTLTDASKRKALASETTQKGRWKALCKATRTTIK